LNFDQPAEYFQGIVNGNGTVGQGLMTSAEDTLQANQMVSHQAHVGKTAMPMLQTGGFNMKHKNATQQVSAKANGARRIQLGGTGLASRANGSESAASIETHNMVRGRNGLKGYSSYGELLNEVVEDEFELTVDDESLHKIIVKPVELALRGRINSVLFQSVYNQQASNDATQQRSSVEARPAIFSRLSKN